MTDQKKEASKKVWKQPRVDAVTNVRETRNGLAVGMPPRESGIFYDS